MQDSDRGTLLYAHDSDLQASFMNSGSIPRINIPASKTKKIIIIGLSGTGKSSIVIKFLYDFTDIEGVGNEEFHSVIFKYKKDDYMLNLVDIEGMDRYTLIHPTKYCLKVDGYIFVYGVDDVASLKFVEVLRDKLYNISGKMIPSILVANKCDLVANRVVPTEEGAKLAKGWGIPYLEISAAKNSTEMISQVFKQMLKEILKSESQVITVKWLKGWDKSKVDELRKTFFLALIFLAFIGVFFITFSLVNLILYRSLMELQGAILIFLIVEGIILLVQSVLGWIGMKREQEDKLSIFSGTLVVSFALTLAIIIMKVVEPVPTAGELMNDNPKAGAEYSFLDPMVFIIAAMSLMVTIFLFVVARISKEIFLKRKNANKSKFATLKV